MVFIKRFLGDGVVVVVEVVVVVVFTRETQATSNVVICKLGGKQFPSALSAVASVVASTRENAVSDVHVTRPHWPSLSDSTNSKL